MGDPHLFADRYEVLGELGRGGMGVVYKVRDRKLERTVALKRFTATSDLDFARFEREARLAAKLDHPNIVRIHDIELSGKDSFITMECVEGTHLGTSALPISRAGAMVLQVADALAYAHDQNILHRDVKPENILIDEEGRARLTDFGLARSVTGPSLTVSGSVVGTPAYMSPEQAAGRSVDVRSDVYSLGATLYHALTGRPPFAGTEVMEVLSRVVNDEPVRPRIVNPAVPKDMETIIQKAMDKNPMHRYPGAAAFAADLRSAVQGDPILARPAPWTRRTTRWIRRHPVASVLMTAAVILCGVGVYTLQTTASLSSEVDRLKELQPLEDAIREARSYFYIQGPDIEFKLMRVRRSLEDLEEIAKDPAKAGHPEVWRTLGIGWYLLGDPETAEKRFLKADRLGEPDGWVNYYLGKIYLERSVEARLAPLTRDADNKLDDREDRLIRDLAEKALRYLTRPYKEWVGAEEIQQRIAEAYLAYAQGRNDEVIRISGESIKRFGNAVGIEEFYFLTGILLKGDDAMRAYDLALERRPHYPWALFMRSLAHADFKPAKADLDRAIRLNPGWTWAYINRGYFRSQLKDLKGAVLDYTEALRIKPEFTPALVNRGLAWLAMGEVDEARSDYEEAIRIAPEDPEAWFNRGNLNREQGDMESAFQDYAEAIRLKDLGRFRYNLAEACAASGRLQEAVDHFSSCIQKKFETPLCLARRGVIHQQLGHIRQAKDDYTRSIQLGPEHAPAWMNRGVVLRLERDLEGALRDFSEAIRLRPKYVEAWINRGSCRIAMKDYEKAVTDLDTAIELDDSRGEAYTNRSVAFYQMGRYPEALSDGDRAVRYLPADARAWLARGNGRWKTGRVDAALEDFDKAVSLDPTDVRPRMQRARIHITRKNLMAAKADLDQVVNIAPAYYKGFKERGVIHAMRGDALSAEKDFTRAIELHQEDPGLYRNRAQARMMLKANDKAVGDFNKAIRLDPGDYLAHSNRGVCLWRLGEHEAARADFRKALEMAPKDWSQRKAIEDLLNR